jgi:hypothetical protein
MPIQDILLSGLAPSRKRHLAPDFGVGRWIRILEIFFSGPAVFLQAPAGGDVADSAAAGAALL